jgi:hypothetical protein
MDSDPLQSRAPAIKVLTREIADADDPRIKRIVAMVDAMISRGPADQLIVPLRRRLATLRPPHPLRFTRLIFYPLGRLIVPPTRWRPGQQAIPRTALIPMAEHVRLGMGAEATSIELEIAGRTTADTELIARTGRSLWPAAARILADPAIPEAWDATELGEVAYRPLADVIAALLAESPTLDTLCAETATGLLPPGAEVVVALLSRIAKMNQAALPIMITLLLDRLPQSASLLPRAREGQEAATMQAAMEVAVDLLLGQFDQPAGIAEARIAAGTLADAGASVSRIATLLAHLETPNIKPKRRDRLRVVRQRLDAACKARFVSALQDDLLAPLQHRDVRLFPTDITALEAAARGLRVLETEARAVGSGATYDLLLRKAVEAIKDNTMQDRLTLVDQLRLVEILNGSDAALAMLDQSSRDKEGSADPRMDSGSQPA